MWQHMLMIRIGAVLWCKSVFCGEALYYFTTRNGDKVGTVCVAVLRSVALQALRYPLLH